MPEWWTYSIEDFLLFSPRVYWRLFELHNAAVWPLPILGLLAGAAILALFVRPVPGSDRAISAGLAVAWAWVAWSFLWHRYATVNWAATYAAAAFAVQALLLGWIGALRGRLHFSAGRPGAGAIGLALLVYAVALHPLAAPVAGRPIRAAEIFAIAPDPTAIATLGALSAAPGGGAALLLVIPLAWCIVSWATLYGMGAPEGWIPLAAAGIAALSRIRFPPVGRLPSE